MLCQTKPAVHPGDPCRQCQHRINLATIQTTAYAEINVIGTVYHPPNAISHVTSTHIVDNIDAVLRQHPSAGVLVVGDFNKMADKPLRDNYAAETNCKGTN